MTMSQLAGYDNINPMINDGDDEMDDEPDEIPSGPGLVNPLLIRRMSQASRGLYHKYQSGIIKLCQLGLLF